MKRIFFLLLLPSLVFGQIDKKKAFFLFNNNNPDYGALSDLIAQPNNNGSVSARIAYSGAVTGNYYKGTYNSATTYAEGDRVSNSAQAYFWFQAKRALTGGAHLAPDPNADNDDWEQLFGVELLHDMGDGTYIRYTLGFNQDDYIRWGSIQRGTLSTASRTIKPSSITSGIAVGASTSGVVVSAVPQSLSYTIPTGLTNLFDKVSVGSSSSSITIHSGGATPNFINVTLATGQSISEGDALKLENTSSNFNIARVISYNSSTGAAYLAIINGVGSGTYTSWTVYKCALVYATWNSAPTSVYVHGLVDTYNSGTGAVTITTFLQLGASGTTRTNWTFFEGRSAPVITSSAGTEVHQTGGVLGVMIRGKYFGTELIHRMDKRSDACGWRYIILDGPDAGDEFTIDGYNSTFQADQPITVSSTLSPAASGGYNFIAFSIASPTSGTNARAGVRHSTNLTNPQSYVHNATVDVFTTTIPIAGQGDSSGEFAFTFKLTGTGDDPYWLPDHNFDRVAFLGSRNYEINGSVVNPALVKTYAYRFQEVTEIQLNQVLEIFHPDQVSKVGDMASTHTITNHGLDYDVTVTPNASWDVSGYTHMIAFPQATNSSGPKWFNTMQVSGADLYTWPGGSSFDALTSGEAGTSNSALYRSTSTDYTGNQLFDLAMWVDGAKIWHGGDGFGYSAGPKQYPEDPRVNGTLTSALRVHGKLFAGHR